MAGEDTWRQGSPSELATFVHTDLPVELRLPTYISRLDLLKNEGPTGLVDQLYKVVVKQAINYDSAPFHPQAGIKQTIRSAQTILADKRATCLDLAVLLAGMCLTNDLLPLIVVVEGHAFLGVDLQYTRQDANRAPGFGAFNKGILTDLETLQDWANDERYLFLECTGAARSQGGLSADFPEGQGRNPKGLMSFEGAGEAGNAQILQHTSLPGGATGANQRVFLYALHIHELQTTYGFVPGQKDGNAAAAAPAPTRTHNQTFGGNARVGTAVSGDVHGGIHTGPIVMGDHIQGDRVMGDKIQGDKYVNYAAPEPASTEQADITKLLTTHRRRLSQLELMAARKGINTEPEIVIEIEDLQREIARLKELLS